MSLVPWLLTSDLSSLAPVYAGSVPVAPAASLGEFVPLQEALQDEEVTGAAGLLLAYGALAFVVSIPVALTYRWYTREPIPTEVTSLLGLAAVALSLNVGVVGLFGDIVGGTAGGLFELETVVFNLLALGLAVATAPAGRAIGDRIATDVFAVAGARELDAEVSRLVRTVGRVTPVELPAADDVGDIEGYDVVPDDTKAAVGGKTLLFPRRLTVAELHDRLVTRVKDDYGVGHVDVELTDEGTVAYLAVGSRAAGIGPTLGPGTVAVAMGADPANSAGPGDMVQVWRPGPPPERVLSGELRATAGDVVTLAVDETDAAKLDPADEYRLVTLPTEPRADREFASLLRAATETMGAATVVADSDLVGEPLGRLDLTVVAVRSAGGTVEAIPPRSRTISVGDTLYVVARPDVLRRIEARATTAVERGETRDEEAAAASDDDD